MTEAEVVEQLIDYTDTLLVAVSLLFTIVSAYVAALNYFVRRANVWGRVGAFAFFAFIFGVLCSVLWGAQQTHTALIGRLQELDASGGLSSVGQSILANAERTAPGLETAERYGLLISIDRIVMSGMWGGLILTVLALFVLTFIVRWGEREDEA